MLEVQNVFFYTDEKNQTCLDLYKCENRFHFVAPHTRLEWVVASLHFFICGPLKMSYTHG